MSISVINRRGDVVPLQLETISSRLKALASMEPPLSISTDVIAVKTVAALVDKIKTSEIDMISAKICASLISEDYEYDDLAARIVISDLHKNTTDDLVQYADDLVSYQYRELSIKILHPKVVAFINCYHKELHAAIDYNRDYMNNYFGAMTLIKSYLLSHKFDDNVKIVKERPQQMLMRVAIGINMNKITESGNTTSKTLESIIDTYELLSRRYYTHATPTLFNAGTINHTLSSCYLLAIDDNLPNIYSRLADTAEISKFSGGIGIHVSQVRASGSVIASTVGRSEGLVPMMQLFNSSARYVSQGGGKRKGSTAVYLEPWHADIESAILSQKQQGAAEMLCRDLFLALWVPDLFMERLKQSLKTKKPVMWSLVCPHECPGLPDTYGEEFDQLYLKYESEGRYRKQVNIRDLWRLIMLTQIETGKPYLMYKDHVNRKCNQNNLGVIKSSNLCVAGDTRILTDKGYVRIRDVAGQTVKIWDTTKFIDAPVRQTGTNQKLLKVTTDDGCELKCTEYHKFATLQGLGPSITKYVPAIKEAKDLKIGDTLKHSNYPIVEGNSNDDIKYPYTHGFYCGDGTNYKNADGSRKYACIDLYHGKQSLISHIDYARRQSDNKAVRRQRVILHDDIASKFVVPINATIDNKLLWLAGYLDADGTIVQCAKTTQCIQAASIHKKFLLDIKLMCNTLGLNPKIKLNKLAGKRMMPANDGTGQLKEYNCKTIYRLQFTSGDTYFLFKELGMITHRLKFIGHPPSTHSLRYIRIASVEEVDGLHDTFCFRSKDTNMGIFAGMPSFQCAEINLYTDSSNVGVCNLASVCLPRFMNVSTGEFDYQNLCEVVQKVVVNMNKVIDNNKYPLAQAKQSDSQNRPIGIGVQGLAEVFMMMKTSFDSPLAVEMNKKIFETMYFGALTASNALAKIDGVYPNFSTSMTARGTLQFDLWNVTPSDMWDWSALKAEIKETGLRNSLLLCIMPTASSSIICNHTESVEPLQSNIFTRSTLSGRFQVVNQYLMRDLKKLGLWTKAIRNQIIMNEGSVQNIDAIPLKIRQIYKTVFEYKLTSLIRMGADREAFICQSSSNNRFIANPDISILTNMHLFSWKHGQKCSSYYVRVKQQNVGRKLIDHSDGSDGSDNETEEGSKTDGEECLFCQA